MDLLAAALGPVTESEWRELVTDLRRSTESPWADWESPRGVRLGVATAGGPPRDALFVGGELAAVCGATRDNDRAGDTAHELVRTYREGGPKALGELAADYSFALWDAATESLWLGSDTVGLHGLAYAFRGPCFFASSRATAVLRAMGDPAWDRGYIADVLSGLWCGDPTGTAFSGVRRMTGDQILRVSSRGAERVAARGLRFSGSRGVAANDVIEGLRERVQSSVADRFDAEHCGVALSGGVDSTVVAAGVARSSPEFDAFTIVAPSRTGGLESDEKGALRDSPLFACVRSHVVDCLEVAEAPAVADDPVPGGLAMQHARVALLRAMRAAGKRVVFDGEGGDEVFDLAWQPADWWRDAPLAATLRAAHSPGLYRRLIRSALGQGLFGPVSARWIAREEHRLPLRRPWLRPSFWAEASFRAAWGRAVAYGSLRRPAQRLPLVLGLFARTWRAQALARLTLGMTGFSPLVDRRIVEYAGGLPPRLAYDPIHSKILLRRMLEGHVVGATAWRPKHEPVEALLTARVALAPESLERATAQIRAVSVLSEHVDLDALARASAQVCAQAPRVTAGASYLVQFFSLAAWMSSLQEAYGVR